MDFGTRACHLTRNQLHTSCLGAASSSQDSGLSNDHSGFVALESIIFRNKMKTYKYLDL